VGSNPTPAAEYQGLEELRKRRGERALRTLVRSEGRTTLITVYITASTSIPPKYMPVCSECGTAVGTAPLDKGIAAILVRFKLNTI
jgi:hypothetical protein